MYQRPIHTSRLDRTAPFVLGLILVAIVAAFILAGAHQLAGALAQVHLALGGAA